MRGPGSREDRRVAGGWPAANQVRTVWPSLIITGPELAVYRLTRIARRADAASLHSDAVKTYRTDLDVQRR